MSTITSFFYHIIKSIYYDTKDTFVSFAFGQGEAGEAVYQGEHGIFGINRSWLCTCTKWGLLSGSRYCLFLHGVSEGRM